MEQDETGISLVCSRLVVPTEIDSPSMFHPTLICSSSSSSYLPPPILEPSSSSSSVPAFLHYSGAQVERETSMEEAMKSSLRKESSLHQQQLLHHRNKAALSEDSGGYTERWGLSGEGFSVDELLNLGDYVGSDKDAEAAEPFEAENTGRSDSESNSSLSSAVSGLSFQPPAPPPPPEPSSCDINLPAHDAAELEWVSFIIDDSHSGYTQTSGAGSFPRPPLPHSHEETTNPAAAAAQGGHLMETAAPSKAKRSKRLRSAVLSTTWFMSCSLLLAGSASSTTTTTAVTTSSYSSSDTSDACLIYDHPPTAAGDESFLLYDASPQRRAPATKQAQAPPKKRGRKPKHPAAGAGERRCSHCGAQKTPQWRAGPLGAKTLCNACGVRFKSGRLLPEYRPACSPTFVSHVHSNSHRKVLEMRRKKEVELPLPAAALPVGTRIGWSSHSN